MEPPLRIIAPYLDTLLQAPAPNCPYPWLTPDAHAWSPPLLPQLQSCRSRFATVLHCPTTAGHLKDGLNQDHNSAPAGVLGPLRWVHPAQPA